MKNKGFMLLETLIASTVILGALIFLYAQFSAIKRTFNTSFKYNTIPGLYEAKTLANFLENDGYALYINELSNSDKGYLDINDCHNSRSSLCRKILNNIDAKNVLFVSDNISTLQNDLSINNYDKTIFNEDFKNFILTMNTIENQGRYQLIVSYKDNTFASIPIGVSNADEQKIQYQVNHYLMNIDGSSYELKETDEYTWFKGYEITPEVNNYTGFTAPESQTIILTDDTKEVNYYYDRNKYNVTVNYGEHIQSIENDGLHYQGSEVDIIVNLDDGYKVSSVTGDVTDISFTMPTHDVNINLTADVQNYLISFDSNGGSVSQDSKNVAYLSKYGELPTPSRTNYIFLGWFTSDGTQITSESIVSITNNHTLYAHWQANNNEFTMNLPISYSVDIKNAATDTSLRRIGSNDTLSITVSNGTAKVNSGISTGRKTICKFYGGTYYTIVSTIAFGTPTIVSGSVSRNLSLTLRFNFSFNGEGGRYNSTWSYPGQATNVTLQYTDGTWKLGKSSVSISDNSSYDYYYYEYANLTSIQLTKYSE